MLFKDVIVLHSVTSSTNDYGDTVESSEDKIIFANKKSIRQSEFYQAQSANLKPELMFEIHSSEYEDEMLLTYESVQYNIIRAFSKNSEITELICSKHVRE